MEVLLLFCFSNIGSLYYANIRTMSMESELRNLRFREIERDWFSEGGCHCIVGTCGKAVMIFVAVKTVPG